MVKSTSIKGLTLPMVSLSKTSWSATDTSIAPATPSTLSPQDRAKTDVFVIDVLPDASPVRERSFQDGTQNLQDDTCVLDPLCFCPILIVIIFIVLIYVIHYYG
ncbi:GfV-B25-ORF2 [Ichnoviriform fumiferanae]|uniref:GfV-B25-ORF2 n=1 Tax=Ichnoviriform fumiferanae TaxID=419435 RepID=A2PZS3_9VIRU|nr:GfV-B25-ORF2 [Ichnoviriform fumiferanae]BAF45495.1 GfV-B25-ORF2 [Ichnoviriform fumiferanae]